MSLPPNYIEWVTRVSSLVEHLYPFEGTEWERRYKSWLKSKWIAEPEYIAEACDVGTFIHLQMEHKVLGNPLDVADDLYSKHRNEIDNWLDFMDSYKFTDMQTEIYCRDKHNRYQGSIDFLWTSPEGKKVLIDWKTWGIAKKRYWLPNKTTKPYDKLKKVALQMSLYAKALWNIDEIWVVWLHDEGAFVYKLELVEDSSLEELIESHQNKDLEIIIKKDKMDLPIEVEILLPTEQYGNVKIKLDLGKVDNWKTDKEVIDALIKKANYIRTAASPIKK